VDAWRGLSRFGITDAEGRFTIDDLPPGQVAYLAATPSNEFVGTVHGVGVRHADIEAIEICQLSTLQIELKMAAPSGDGSRRGIRRVSGPPRRRLRHAGRDRHRRSAARSATPHSLDSDGNPLLDDTTFRFFIMPLVVLANIGIDEPGALQISVSHPTQACTVDFPSPPTLPNHITWVGARCD
jgi:hypothetical protein